MLAGRVFLYCWLLVRIILWGTAVLIAVLIACSRVLSYISTSDNAVGLMSGSAESVCCLKLVQSALS